MRFSTTVVHFALARSFFFVVVSRRFDVAAAAAAAASHSGHDSDADGLSPSEQQMARFLPAWNDTNLNTCNGLFVAPNASTPVWVNGDGDIFTEFCSLQGANDTGSGTRVGGDALLVKAGTNATFPGNLRGGEATCPTSCASPNGGTALRIESNTFTCFSGDAEGGGASSPVQSSFRGIGAALEGDNGCLDLRQGGSIRGGKCSDTSNSRCLDGLGIFLDGSSHTALLNGLVASSITTSSEVSSFRHLVCIGPKGCVDLNGTGRTTGVVLEGLGHVFVLAGGSINSVTTLDIGFAPPLTTDDASTAYLHSGTMMGDTMRFQNNVEAIVFGVQFSKEQTWKLDGGGSRNVQVYTSDLDACSFTNSSGQFYASSVRSITIGSGNITCPIGNNIDLEVQYVLEGDSTITFSDDPHLRYLPEDLVAPTCGCSPKVSTKSSKDFKSTKAKTSKQAKKSSNKGKGDGNE